MGIREIAHSRTGAVIAGATVLVTLGGVGGAVAAGHINSSDIRDQTIRGHDIGAGGVASSEVENGSLGLRDLNAYTNDKINNSGARSQPGPQGPAGPAGEDGTDGTNGTNGTDGTDGTDGADGVSGYVVRTFDYANVGGGGIATVACADGAEDSGLVATGGGYWFKDEANMTSGTSVLASFPGRMDWTTNTPKPDRTDGWIVQVNKPANMNPGTLTVYAICANVG